MSKICLRCQTENNDNFRYCKYCGATLPTVESKRDDIRSHINANGDPVDGLVNDLELETFVGVNAKNIMPKFLTIRRGGRKIFLCLPVLLLGFFTGCFGMAAYFFFRKMTKIGVILTLCGILLTAGNFLINLQAEKDFINSVYPAYMTAIEKAGDPAALNAAAEELSAELDTAYAKLLEETNPILYFIDNYLVRSLVPVALGFYTAYLYYKNALEKIGRIKETLPEEEQPRAIKSAGGISVGLIFIPVAASIFTAFLHALLLLI